MIRREYGDRDGACFAASVFNECMLMGEYDKNCGSYKCPFYKPFGCKDWVKLEDENGVSLYAPEELDFDGEERKEED